MSKKNESPKTGENRRQFLKKTGTAAAAASLLKVPVYGANRAPSVNVKGANDRIVIGFVGVGGRGFGAHVRQMRQHAEGNNIAQAAVCDVSTHRANHAKKFVSDNSEDKVEAYTDYRKVLERKDIDAVLIATGVYKTRDLQGPGSGAEGIVRAIDYLTASNRKSFGDTVEEFESGRLNAAGKKVVVIGSGATAVTIVPSMADKAAHVTMLQRTPTYYFSRPAKDGLANWLRKVLPAETAYKITRWKNVTMQDIGFKRARSKPEKVKDFLFKKIRAELGDKFDEQAFTPPYDPWDQRLCLVPDADLFRAMREGRASIATGHIDKFEERGIRLKSGELVEADIIITATGLKLAMAGKIDVSIEGEPVKFEERFYYKGAMFSNLPNLSAVFGYLNASWTLRADLVSEYTCRVLNRMAEKGADLATPVLPDDHGLEEDDIFDFSSGYIQRSKHIMPKNATAMPWRLNQEYVRDRKDMKTGAVEDGILAFGKAKVAPDAKSETLEPAE